MQTAIITLSSTIALVMEDYNIADAEDVPKLIDALIELSKNPTQEEKHETILVNFNKYYVGNNLSYASQQLKISFVNHTEIFLIYL